MGLLTVPQIRSSHNTKENIAVKKIKSRHPFHFYHGQMLFCSNDIQHIVSHMPVDILL